jgi:hypothetical protein
MKSLPTLKLLAFTVLLGAQTGCGNRLFFATKTSIGLEASGTAQMPDKVSFSSSRYEGAIVPRSINGDPYSVYGSLDADVKWLPPTYTIRQTFATGRAAQIASGIENPPATTPLGVSRDPLFFVTDTSFGLKISAGKQDVSPTFVLGYKRVEGTVIPVAKNEVEARSVYADIAINSSTNTDVPAVTNNFPHNNGVRIRQSFATGKAADNAALTDAVVRAKLKAAAAGLSVDQAQVEAVIGETGDKIKNAGLVADFVWQPQNGGEPTPDDRKGRLTKAFQGIGRLKPERYVPLPKDSLKDHLANGLAAAELTTAAANIKKP